MSKKIRNSQETSSPENKLYSNQRFIINQKKLRANYIYSSVKIMHQAIQNKPKLRNIIGLIEINKANTIGPLEIFTGLFRYFLPSPTDKIIKTPQLMLSWALWFKFLLNNFASASIQLLGMYLRFMNCVHCFLTRKRRIQWIH